MQALMSIFFSHPLGCQPEHMDGRDRVGDHLEGFQEAHADLDAAPLPIGHFVQPPVLVNPQKVHQQLPAIGVHPLHPPDHISRPNVALQLKCTSINERSALCPSKPPKMD